MRRMNQPCGFPHSFLAPAQFSPGLSARSISRSSIASPGSRCSLRGRWGTKVMRLCVLLAVALAAASCSTYGGRDSWPGPTHPYQGRIHFIPGTIELEDFDEGDEGVAYHDL